LPFYSQQALLELWQRVLETKPIAIACSNSASLNLAIASNSLAHTSQKIKQLVFGFYPKGFLPLSHPLPSF
jgi:hypothetical protein